MESQTEPSGPDPCRVSTELVDLYVDNEGNSSDVVSLTFHLNGKLHSMSRQKTECIAATLKRLLSTLNKSADKKKSARRSPTKHLMAPTSPVILDAMKRRIADWESLTNSDWCSGMLFTLVMAGDWEVQFCVTVDPPVVTVLSCFPRSRLMVGGCIVARASTKRTQSTRFQWFAELPDGVSAPVLVSEGEIYSPTAQVIGARVKLICTPICMAEEGLREGRPCVLYLSGTVAPPLLLSRALRQHCIAHPSEADASTFRVMCYNILADIYSNTEYARKILFSYVTDERYLHEDHRSQLVMNELMTSRADIICLQEVEIRLFNEYISPCLRKRKDGKPISSIDSGIEYHMRYTNKNSSNMEGCAMLLSQSRFHVVYELDIPLGYAVFADPVFKYLIESHEEVADILGARVGTIAQVCVVQDIAVPSCVAIISNSHYFYHPKANYVRLMHTKVLLDIIEDIKINLLGTYGLLSLINYRPFYTNSERYLSATVAADMVMRFSEPLPTTESLKVGVIFMGDLNSRPGTAAEQLIKSGFVDKHHPVWGGVDEFYWNYRPDEENEESVSSVETTRINRLTTASGLTDSKWPVSLAHNLSLDSVIPIDHEKYYTNYTRDFKDVLDYIFIDQSILSIVRAPTFPTDLELMAETAIPSSQFPSDHVPLLTDLRFNI